MSFSSISFLLALSYSEAGLPPFQMHIVHNGKCPFFFFNYITLFLAMRIMDMRTIIWMMLCNEKLHFFLLCRFLATKLLQELSNSFLLCSDVLIASSQTKRYRLVKKIVCWKDRQKKKAWKSTNGMNVLLTFLRKKVIMQ